MKFTLSWLKEYLNINSSPLATLEEICHKLNNIGLEVETVEDQAKDLFVFTVAQIIEAKPHPDSAKLQICNVDVGTGQNLQIVCGAKNARSGLKVAYAPIGAVIPANKMVIKKAKIAGVESNGMLCSAEELGLHQNTLELNNNCFDAGGSCQGAREISEKQSFERTKNNVVDGIIEIDEKFAIGTKIAEVFGLNEAVIELSITPNRGDCLGVYGIARDLAAAGIGVLQSPQIKNIEGKFESPIKAKIHSENCKYFSGFYIKNIKNQPSPKWLKERLEAVGLNSISAIVDITNYVMLSLNQPLHAYDAYKLKGESLVVSSKSLVGNFRSLKDIDYKLSGEELVIENGGEVVGLAGIIGGSSTAVSLDTKNIFLEAAFFDATNIAKTGRALNILSDARYRFERTVDISNVKNALKMAVNLIVEICGSESTEISQIVEVGSDEFIQPEIEFDLSQIKQIIGIEIDKNFVLKTLKDLGFKAQELSGNLLKVQVPAHRNDVRISQDLVEEIIRIYGLNKITSMPLWADNAGFIAKSPLEIVRDKLVSFGCIETINYSFVDENLAALFSEILPELKLQNPIAAQMNYMRPNLLIGLLQNVAKNQTRGFSDLALFETGRIFLKVEPNQQKNSVAGIRVGKNKAHNHYKDERFFDVFDVKKDLFASLESLGFSASSFLLSDEAPNYYHPHRSKAVKLGKNIVGYFGELHPMIAKKFAKKFDLKTNLGRVNIFEIFVQELPINLNKKTSKKSFGISDLLPVNRDFAFILDSQVAVGDLLKTVASVDKNLITDVNLFDIYYDKKLGENKKSIAFSIKIQPIEKTLTGEEIEAISQKIIGEVERKFGGVLRGMVGTDGIEPSTT